jgi:hypothetical protein
MTYRTLIMVLATNGCLILLACPSSNQGEILPGIPADTRLVDLDQDQARTLCVRIAELGGGEGNRLVCTDGTEFNIGSVESCVSDLDTLPERYPDCARLVSTQLSFYENIHDNCDQPGFDPQAYEGGRSCSEP